MSSGFIFAINLSLNNLLLKLSNIGNDLMSSEPST